MRQWMNLKHFGNVGKRAVRRPRPSCNETLSVLPLTCHFFFFFFFWRPKFLFWRPLYHWRSPKGHYLKNWAWSAVFVSPKGPRKIPAKSINPCNKGFIIPLIAPLQVVWLLLILNTACIVQELHWSNKWAQVTKTTQTK